MTDWKFYLLVGLLVWNLWRTRTVAQTSPWLRDALLRRIFGQLNRIEARQRNVPLPEVEQEAEAWWHDELTREAGRPKGWPSPFSSRPVCGPWCHDDWQTRGVSRRDEIKIEVKIQAERSEFRASKRAAEESPQDAQRQYDLAMHYSTGYGVDKDEREAERLFKRAKELGWRPLSDFTIGNYRQPD